MTWSFDKDAVGERVTDHCLALATLAALAYPGVAQYLRLPLLLLHIASALGVVLVVIVAALAIYDFRDRRLSAAHGIEHATIALLMRLSVPMLSGSSAPGHFTVRIPREFVLHLWRERIQDAAKRAVEQIAAGDTQLAYTADCGTTWIAKRAVLCICIFAFSGFALLVDAPPHVGLLAVAAAVWCAGTLGHVVGIAVQRGLTVGTDWASVSIGDVDVSEGEGTFDFRVHVEIAPRPRSGA